MKTLFNEDGKLNEDGERFSEELRDSLTDLVDSYIHEGYAKHEVSYILMTTAHVISIQSEWRKRQAESIGEVEEE